MCPFQPNSENSIFSQCTAIEIINKYFSNYTLNKSKSNESTEYYELLKSDIEIVPEGANSSPGIPEFDDVINNEQNNTGDSEVLEYIKVTNKKLQGSQTKTYIGEYFLFIISDGAKLLQAHKAVQPYTNELIVFIEDNKNDLISGAQMRIKQGSDIKDIRESSRLSKSTYSYTNSVIPLSKEDFEEMINRSNSSVPFLTFMASVVAKSNSVYSEIATMALSKVEGIVDASIEGFDKFVDDKLKFSESLWNVEHEDFNKKIDVNTDAIANFTSGLESIESKINELSFSNIVKYGGIASLATGPFSLPFVTAGGALSYVYSDDLDSVFNKMKEQIGKSIREFREFVNDSLEKTIDLANVNINLYIANFCGMWSGIIDFFADWIRLILMAFKLILIGQKAVNSIPKELSGLLADIIKDPAYYYYLILEQIDNTIEAISRFSFKDFIKSAFAKFSGLLSKIGSAIGQKIENANFTEWAFALGYTKILIVDIAISIMFPGLLIAKIGKLGKAGTLMAKIIKIVEEVIGKALGLAFKGVKLSGKLFFNIWQKVTGAIAKGWKAFDKIVDEIIELIGKLIDELFLNIKLELFIFVKGVRTSLRCTFLPIEDFLKLVGKVVTNDLKKLFTALGIGFSEIPSEKGIYAIFDPVTKAILKKGPKELMKKEIDKIEKLAKKSYDDAKKYVDELAVETKSIRTHLIKEVPGIKKFGKWFDNLTLAEFEIVWKNTKLRNKIQSRLRHPGGLHEWLMVSRANIFKKWGVSVDDIKKLRTKIEEVIFKNPPGIHGGKGSTKAHNEILKLIDNSNDYTDFVKKLVKWSNKRLEGGSNKLPKEFKELIK